MKFVNFIIKRNVVEEDLYIRILLWAYKKQETGFTWEEVKQEFKLSPSQSGWVLKIFKTESDADRKFFENYRYDDVANQHYLSINEKGMTAAINYLALKDAENGSVLALKVAAISALFTTIGIGLQLIQMFFNNDKSTIYNTFLNG